MKVPEYAQMIRHMTRDKTTDVPGSMAHGLRTGLYDGGRVGFAKAKRVQKPYSESSLAKKTAEATEQGLVYDRKTKQFRKPVERTAYGVTPKTQVLLDLITPVRQKYIDLKEAQINNPKGGTLKDFPNYEQFLIKEIDSVKNTKDVKKLISSTRYYLDSPEKLSESRKRLLDNLIDIENKVVGRARPGHELAVQAGYVYKTRRSGKSGKTTTAPSGSFENLIDINQKKLNRIDDVIRQLDSGQIPLDDIIKEGSLTRYINKPFGFKDPESFNGLIRKNKKYADRLDEFKLLNNQSFLNKYKGRGIMADEAQNVFERGRTGGKNFSQVTQSGPLRKIMQFADRHVDQGGELIRKIDDNSFIYNNKIFSTAPDGIDKKALQKLGLQNQKVIDLVLEGPKQKEFKNIYNAFDKLKEYELIERAHPITGKKTPLTKLLQEADYIATGRNRSAAENIFSRNPFEVDHFGSVKDDPFKNIRIIPRTINQAAGNIKPRGVSTFKDIKQAEDFIGYNFTGDPLNSLNQYIDTEIQRGQNPDYTGRSRKIAAAKTKAIDKAASEIGQAGTKGGQVLTQSIPEGVLGNRITGTLDKRMVDAYTGVPILEKTAGGKLTVGSRPVTVNEPNISVAERDAMAKNLTKRLMNLDLNFLPKKIRTPLEIGQNIIKGVSKKDGGRIPFSVGSIAKAGAKAAGYGALTPSGITTIFGPPGLDMTEASNRIALGLEATFLKDLVKSSISATEKLKNSKGLGNPKIQRIVQQALNLGVPTKTALKIARSANPIGMLMLAGEALYQGGKYSKKRISELQAMSPEERAELAQKRDDFSFGEYSGAAEGGIASLNVKK